MNNCCYCRKKISPSPSLQLSKNTLPNSPEWDDVKYTNLDRQPDMELAKQKVYDFYIGLHKLLKTPMRTHNITQLEYYTSSKITTYLQLNVFNKRALL